MGVWIFCRIVGTVTETMIKDYIDKQKNSLDEIFKIVKQELGYDFQSKYNPRTLSAGWLIIFLIFHVKHKLIYKLITKYNSRFILNGYFFSLYLIMIIRR